MKINNLVRVYTAIVTRTPKGWAEATGHCWNKMQEECEKYNNYPMKVGISVKPRQGDECVDYMTYSFTGAWIEND